MRYLNTLYITDHQSRVSYRRNSLVVRQPSGSTRVPLETLDSVIIIGAAQITNQALTECTRRHVQVSAMRRGGSIKFVVTGGPGGNVHLRSRQHHVASDEAESLSIAKLFVAGKLQNSRRVIQRWALDSPEPLRSRLYDAGEVLADRLNRVASAPSHDHLRGIEGDAARAHFTAVGKLLADTHLPFAARQRRPPRDPVNALLGFCYGLTTTECEGAAVATGLDPQVGFLHQPRSGRSSLALDLLEELRPITDRFVVTLVRRQQIGPDDFITTPGGGVYLSDTGRRNVISAWETHKGSQFEHRVAGRPVERWALPTIQATLLARHLRGDLESYPPFVLAA